MATHVTSPTRRLSFGLDRFSGLYLLGLFIVVFGIWTPDLFLTQTTLTSILSSQAILGMLAIAALLPLACGTFDLSVASTINASAVAVSVLQTSKGMGMWTSIGLTMAACLMIGVINGFIIVRLQVDSFIATLGTSSVIAALQVIVSPTQPLLPVGEAWTKLGGASFGGIQIAVIYLLVLALVAWWATEHTPAGRYLYAIGANREAARLSGVRVERYIWGSLIASSLIAGAAGIIYASQFGPSLSFGHGMLLPTFAAIFLGSTQLRPGRFNIWGTVLAIYVLAAGVRGFELATSQQWINGMFNGVALVGAVSFALWRQRGGAFKRKRGPGGSSPVDPTPPTDGPGARTAPEPDLVPSSR